MQYLSILAASFGACCHGAACLFVSLLGNAPMSRGNKGGVKHAQYTPGTNPSPVFCVMYSFSNGFLQREN